MHRAPRNFHCSHGGGGAAVQWGQDLQGCAEGGPIADPPLGSCWGERTAHLWLQPKGPSILAPLPASQLAGAPCLTGTRNRRCESGPAMSFVGPYEKAGPLVQKGLNVKMATPGMTRSMGPQVTVQFTHP